MRMSGQGEGHGKLPRRNSIVEFMKTIMEEVGSDDDGSDHEEEREGAATTSQQQAAAAGASPSFGGVEASPLPLPSQRKRTRAPVLNFVPTSHESSGSGSGSGSQAIDESLFADVTPEELNRWLYDEADDERKQPAAWPSATTTTYSARVAGIRRAAVQQLDAAVAHEDPHPTSSFAAPSPSMRLPQHHHQFAHRAAAAYGHDAAAASAKSSGRPRARANSLDLTPAAAPPSTPAPAPRGSMEAELQSLPEERHYQRQLQLASSALQADDSVGQHVGLSRATNHHQESRDAKRRRMLMRVGRRAESERVLGSGPMYGGGDGDGDGVDEGQAGVSDFMVQGHYSTGSIGMQDPMMMPIYESASASSASAAALVSDYRGGPMAQQQGGGGMFGTTSSQLISQFGQMQQQQQLAQQTFSQDIMRQAPPFAHQGDVFSVGGMPPQHLQQQQPNFLQQSFLSRHQDPIAHPPMHPEPGAPVSASKPQQDAADKFTCTTAASTSANPLQAHPSIPSSGLRSTMEASQESQQSIHDWDRTMGLRRSHSKTMRASSRSRKKLQELQAMQDMMGMNLVLNEHRAKMA